MNVKYLIPKKYCMPVMFDFFVYALLGFFCASFLKNTKPNKPGEKSYTAFV